MQCPKCGYVRQATDRAPETDCPMCGIIYAKFRPAVLAPPLAATGGQPPPAVPKAKKSGMFAPIESREDALKAVKDCGNAFYFVAGLQVLVSFLLGFSILVDAAVYAICGWFIRSRHSRAAAVIVSLVSLLELVVTVLNRMGQHYGGGSNVFLAFIVMAAGARSVEATFKLSGRYKEELVEAQQA